MPKRFGTLGWRILIWMALVALGPLVVMAYQGYHCARQAIVESKQEHLRSVLESKKTRIETWLREIEADMRFLAVAPCVRTDCAAHTAAPGEDGPGEACNLLEHVRTRSAAYESLATYNRGWKILKQTRVEGTDEEHLLPLDFTSRLDEADGMVLSSHHLLEDGTIDLHTGHPIFGRDGIRAGFLVADLDLTATLDPILRDRSGLGRTGKVILLSQNGKILRTSTGRADRVGRKAVLPEALLSTGSPEVHAYIDSRDTEVLGAAAAVPGLGWTVLVEVDQDEAFAWLGRLRKRATVTGVITLVLVLVLAARGAGRLSRPLRQLAAVAGRIARGRHEERLGPLEGAEAQEVAQAFNTMLDEIALSHRRLMHAASLAAVGELSSSIVHEMRNPLSSVKINLQALRRKVKGDDAHTELAEIALGQVRRLETMLSDLLGYGKPLQLNLESLEIGALAREVAEFVNDEVWERRISVEVKERLGRPTITADAEQIQRALTNLVINAVQASPKGGRVVIAIQKDPADPNRVAVTVSDQGPGIPDENKEKIFQPFFTAREGGTGLGLANVKKIVDYHGGTVAAGDHPHGGAMLTMILPIGGPPA